MITVVNKEQVFQKLIEVITSISETEPGILNVHKGFIRKELNINEITYETQWYEIFTNVLIVQTIFDFVFTRLELKVDLQSIYNANITHKNYNVGKTINVILRKCKREKE
jgi:hypothetical protein